MHRRHSFFLTVMLIATAICGSVSAQDQGIPDTIRVGVADVEQGDHFSVPVTMFNDDPVEAASLGFWWDTERLSCDSVSWVGSSASHIAAKPVYIDNVAHNVLIGVIKIFEPPITIGDSLLATIYFTAQPTAPDTIIAIDSGFIPPAGTFKINIGSGFEGYSPQYKEGTVVIGDPQPPPVFVLSGDQFDFEAFEGGSDPTPQVLQITNGGGQTLNWTATWDAAWLDILPPSGTAPSSVSIAPSVSGLAAGSYSDTVTVTDPNATNSPQTIIVDLEVIVPPPTIELVPDHFEFMAQQDSTDPDPQVLTINDVGAGTLDWAASNSQPWLTLSSYSGLAGESVDVMVSITGMTFGTYYDTIVVEDPAATNSPQIAPVQLTIVSGFPVLSLDPDSFYVASTPGTDPYPRPITISNTGGDYLYYTVSSKKGYMTFDPDSGAVVSGDPAEPIVTFETQSLSFGFHYDTIVVESPNAQDAPQEIPVMIWMMENPPSLEVSPASLDFVAYECYNWPPVEPEIMVITNGGGEDLNWTIFYNEPWLSFEPVAGPNEDSVYVYVDVTGLDLGTYFDTIVVEPEFSLTPPESLEVVLVVIEQTADPVVGVSQNHFEFIFKHNEVGTAEKPLDITNLASGCMSWYVAEDEVWLDVEPDTGQTPALIWVGVNGFGQPLGKSSTSFEVFAVGAATPEVITVDMYVWTFGDADCSGMVDIDDVVYLVKYIFLFGPDPCPRVWIGDANCSHGDVDIDDVVYLINWIFLFGPDPCEYPMEPPAGQLPATHTFLELQNK